MNVLADEDLHRGIAERLVADGHDVMHIAALAPGISDEDVLAWAVGHEALLVTNDLDFGELVYARGALHTGVLLLRLGAMPFEEQGILVARTLWEHGSVLDRAFSVLTRTRLRVRGRLLSSAGR